MLEENKRIFCPPRYLISRKQLSLHHIVGELMLSVQICGISALLTE